MTKVKFLIEKPGGDLPCNVFAFFPEERYNNIDKDIFMSYAHIGQHSGCHIEYANECKEATMEQYSELIPELQSVGYDEFTVINNGKEIEYRKFN